MITVARIESELDYWFAADPPVCSVLRLLGTAEDVTAALRHLAVRTGVAECRAAVCASRARSLPFSGAGSYEELLHADLGFTGSAVEAAASPIVRHPSSRGSSCQVVSAAPSRGGEIWQLMTAASSVRVCAGLFSPAARASEDWIYSALRLVLVGGTTVLNRGASQGAQNALAQAFLADTLQSDGIAVTKGGLELCGTGVALTGRTAAIDEAEQMFPAARQAEETLVRRSVELAGPWSGPGYRAYRSSPETGRWVP